MVRSNLTLSQTFDGFVFYKTATGKSPHTISDYRVTQKKVMTFFEADPFFVAITRTEWVKFFAWLTTDYVAQPGGVAPRPVKRLSPKSIFNIHTNLSSLYSWAIKEEIVERNLIQLIDPPPFEDPVIVPFTKDEIGALLKACDRSRGWQQRPGVSTARPTALRDRTIVYLLFDSGIRAEELCNIQIKDLNMGNNSITVRGKGAGNDKAERTVYYGKQTARSLWKMLAPRLGKAAPDSPLFLNSRTAVEAPMNRNMLWQMLKDLGERAGVANVHPHRFRHTFAVTYLRNGGDVFTLQTLLGHSDMEMTRRYLALANVDCANVHRKASPVDNWKI
jgi:integrase/recombinase XerD